MIGCLALDTDLYQLTHLRSPLMAKASKEDAPQHSREQNSSKANKVAAQGIVNASLSKLCLHDLGSYDALRTCCSQGAQQPACCAASASGQSWLWRWHGASRTSKLGRSLKR